MRAPLLLGLCAAVACARPPAPVVPASPAPASPSPAAARPASPTAARLHSPAATRVADSLLALMTLDEKLGQLTMMPAAWNQTGPAAPAGGEDEIRAGRLGSFLSFWGAAPTLRMQRIAVEESRLKIPLLFAQDVIHGWRTIFPVGIGQAASFDTALVREAARIAAVEATSHGLHWTFAPMVDIARDPRWGRIVEGSGEDPHLASVMAVAQVRGYQGDDLSSPTTLLATVKHYAAYGAAEGGRDYNVAELSERTLWETYMPPYLAAVQAGAGSVMASFNEIGGTPAHASSWLLTDVLRDRWGFDGVLVSDWTGVQELLAHGVAAAPPEAAARGIEAGVDIDMSAGIYRSALPEALRSGRVRMSSIDSAVHRVLRAKHALGLFDDPYRYSDTVRERTSILTAEHRAVARTLARESIVLLENDSVGGRPALPLRAGLASIAVIGPLADDRKSAVGSWAGAGRPEDAISVLDGVRTALGSRARVTHVRGTSVDTVDVRGIDAAVAAARAADAVLLVLGEREDMSAEAMNRASIELPGSQLELAQRVVRAVRAQSPAKPVVALIMSGRPMAISWLADSVPAILATWYLGVEHGNATADILFGAHAPSGKLPASIPRVTGQIPIHYNHRNTGRPPAADNKYTSKYFDQPWTPQWPFGHGLSYTTFAYEAPKVARDSIRAGEPVRVSVTVRNTGAVAGEEVVQLYLRDDAATVTRPVRELRAFRRVALQPGESRTIDFTLVPEDLALYDLDMRRVIEPGSFTLWAGGSSAATQEAKFHVTGDTLVIAPAPSRMR
jgi:beta-glucosidase